MCAKREEEEIVTEEEEGYHQHHNNVQRFQQDQQLILEEIQQQQNMGINDYSYTNTTSWLMLPSSSSEISPFMHHRHQQPSSWSSLPLVLHQNTNYNPLFQYPTRDHDPFLFPPPPPPQLSYYGGGLFNRRVAGQAGSLQFAYGGATSSSSDHDHLLQGHVGFGLQTEIIMGKMTAQEMMDAKALAASKSHSEAERRRRERINNHLAKLRSLLPSTTKTDKASLLAEVIQHVKELKRQTSIIAEQSLVPTEIDELSVQQAYSDREHRDGGGKLVIRASLCCDDRSDLLPDLIKTLKALKLRTLKAEITTLGGRVKNVLFITAEEEEDDDDDHINNNNNEQHQQQMVNSIISTIQEALKQVMEKSVNGDHDSSSINYGCSVVKRQRTNNNIIYP